MRAYPFMLLSGCVLALAACSAELPTTTESPAVCPAPPPISPRSTPAAEDTLFAILGAPQLTAEQERLLSILVSQPTTAEVHLARLTAAAETHLKEGNAVVLNVSPTRSFTMIGERVERQADIMSFEGPIAGEYGWVTLVLSAFGVTGSLQSWPLEGQPANYSFRPLGGGLHALVCVDASKFPPDHPPG